MNTKPTNSTVILARYEERLARAFGFRKSRAALCPRLVVGKRCVRDRGTCLCQRFGHVPLDHVRMWIDGSGRHVLTCEPYGLTNADLDVFRSALAGIGAVVTAADRSYWHPRTTLLIVTGRDRHQRRGHVSAGASRSKRGAVDRGAGIPVKGAPIEGALLAAGGAHGHGRMVGPLDELRPGMNHCGRFDKDRRRLHGAGRGHRGCTEAMR